MIDRQIVVDPRVKGRSRSTAKAACVREAYASYLAALRGLGFTVVENAGLLKVVPEADAKLQAGTVSWARWARRGDQILTQIFRCNHENPNNLVAVLRPLISANNTINANPGNNSLVITDYADNLQRIAKIIAALDQPTATDIEVVPLQHAVASRHGAAGAAPGRRRHGGGARPARMAAGAVSVMADPRSNSLIVRAANPARWPPCAADRAARPAQRRGRPGRQHVGGAPEERRRHQAGPGAARRLWRRRRHQRRRQRGGAALSINPGQATPTGGGGRLGGATTAAQAATARRQGPSTGGFIQADPATNSLIITAPEPLYRRCAA
jgi:general secretion pathway protein D